MRKVDRRTFLVNTMRTSAVAVAAGSVGFYEWELFEPGSSGSEALPGPPRAVSYTHLPAAPMTNPSRASVERRRTSNMIRGTHMSSWPVRGTRLSLIHI